MPRSRLSHAMKMLKNELLISGGKKTAWLAQMMFAQNINPLRVLVETVRFSDIISTTNRNPAIIIIAGITA